MGSRASSRSRIPVLGACLAGQDRARSAAKSAAATVPSSTSGRGRQLSKMVGIPTLILTAKRSRTETSKQATYARPRPAGSLERGKSTAADGQTPSMSRPACYGRGWIPRRCRTSWYTGMASPASIVTAKPYLIS